jgi:ABC-2 type transport system ATP-binding protein
MRADLAAALLHRPGIVYLDEPTIGLDISVKDRVRAMLRQICAEGTTLVLTTHDLGDIEDVCQRIVIIDEGRIIYDGSIEAVKDGFARHRELHLQFLAAGGKPSVRLEDLAALVPDAEVSPGTNASDTTEFIVRFDRFSLTAGLVVTQALTLGEIVDFRLDEPAIEDVIRKVYAGDLLVREPV